MRPRRRDVLKAAGAGSLAAAGLPVMAGPFGQDDGELVPRDKKLDPGWVRSLFERGAPIQWQADELRHVGMPVGGICAGCVYLGGDGRLWLWDVFNRDAEGVVANGLEYQGQRLRERDGANFVDPPEPVSPLDQGFALRVGAEGGDVVRRIDASGFRDVRFHPEYPIGRVLYRDPDVPVTVELEAFSPFVPLALKDSSLPVTVMSFALRNRLQRPVEVTITGWLENAVCRASSARYALRRRNRVVRQPGFTAVECVAEELPGEPGVPSPGVLAGEPDFGALALALFAPGERDLAVPAGGAEGAFAGSEGPAEVERTGAEPLTGALGRRLTLAPGERARVDFALAWRFPNLTLRAMGRVGRHYATRFASVLEVVGYLAAELTRLAGETRRWRDTWWDSSLPRWLLLRTIASTSTLATATCQRFADGRFWAWEGVGCCPGTCTHVWHYAQAVARLFPELERNLREETDLALAFDERTGAVDFRGGLAGRAAADGQAGLILRCYREHRSAAGDAFLRRNWPRIRKALERLMADDAADGAADGMLTGEQHNTLDAEWYGAIPAIASLYLAALAAGEVMAQEVGDEKFTAQCGRLRARGRRALEGLFDGEYFVQREDPEHLEAIGIGRGCYVDQVIGQGWAFQVGLGRLYDEEMIESALRALWTHNFAPDVGPLRASLPPRLRGRPYALAGDAGLLMCTWPKGGKRDDWERHWQFGYFNECMSGFEHQVAGHMLWEGMLLEGLAVERAIHDRYHPSLRNPFNEVECSDHYARAMASYGVFLAACGFEYHGPRGRLAFAPRLSPEDFHAAFTAADGWGRIEQKRSRGVQVARLELRFGHLELRELELELAPGVAARRVRVRRGAEERPASWRQDGRKLAVELEEPLRLRRGDRLTIAAES